MVSTENQDTAISKSYTLLLYPQEEPFPYIVSANIGQFETYDLATEPYELEISLRYSDNLYLTDSFGVSQMSGILRAWFTGASLYQKNPHLKYGVEEVTVDGKEYSLPYTEVLFDMGIPPYQFKEKEPLNVNFVYEIKGLTGANTKKAPANFMLNLSVPPVPEKTVSVEEINITSPTTTMAPGQTLPLTATVLPEDATEKSLTWSSSNPSYATSFLIFD